MNCENLWHKKADITVPLKRYEKSEHIKKLERLLWQRIEHTIFDDIEKTYVEAIAKYGQTNVKVSTDLVEPQVYLVANMRIEIIN